MHSQTLCSGALEVRLPQNFSTDLSVHPFGSFFHRFATRSGEEATPANEPGTEELGTSEEAEPATVE